METHENYNRQHQDLRQESGIDYGDVLEDVNFEYAAKLTAVNALTLASLASAPNAPQNVRIGGAVQPSTKLAWDANDDDQLVGYRVYWRETTSHQWQWSRFIGKTEEVLLENLVIDNYFFGVSAVSNEGYQTPIVFPGPAGRF